MPPEGQRRSITIVTGWTGKKICPHLGSPQDRKVCWAFPHSEQVCWSPGVPKEQRTAYAPLNLDLQKHWCLGEHHTECPYYVPPEKRPAVQPRSPFTFATGRCPRLGIPNDAAIYYAYPSAQNVCHSCKAWPQRGWQQKYAQTSRETQTSYCLTENYRQCPHFEEVAASPERVRRPLPSQDFLRLEGRCPCLGTQRSREVYRIYPSRENTCYSRGAPRRMPWQKPATVSANLQGAYCLTRRYAECEHFVKESASPPRGRGNADPGTGRAGPGPSRFSLWMQMLWACLGGLFQVFLRAGRVP
jgi:hypothetical protein